MYIVNEHVVDLYKNCQKARMSQTLDWREHPLRRRFHVRWVMLHALWTRARCRAKSYAQSKVLKLAAPPFCCKITASSLGTCVTCACSPLIRYVHVSQTVEAPVRPSVGLLAFWLRAHVHLSQTVEAPRASVRGLAGLLITHTCICRKRLKRRVLAFWSGTRAFVANSWSAVRPCVKESEPGVCSPCCFPH
jgi:hypothetical protein